MYISYSWSSVSKALITGGSKYEIFQPHKYCYHLIAIGAPGPNLYIAEEISDVSTDYIDTNDNTNSKRSSFKIAGGKSDMKVSWQVTGIRKDPWANAHRAQVEEVKPDKERGYYIYPDLYGQPAESENKPLGISRRNQSADRSQEQVNWRQKCLYYAKGQDRVRTERPVHTIEYLSN